MLCFRQGICIYSFFLEFLIKEFPMGKFYNAMPNKVKKHLLELKNYYLLHTSQKIIELLKFFSDFFFLQVLYIFCNAPVGRCPEGAKKAASVCDGLGLNC